MLTCSTTLGITTRNSAPRPPGPSPTSIEPPAVATRCLHTARPRPVPTPAAFVVKNGSKTPRAVATGTPGPCRLTASRSRSAGMRAPAMRDRAVIAIVAASAIACAAFWTRLTSTCWSACGLDRERRGRGDLGRAASRAPCAAAARASAATWRTTARGSRRPPATAPAPIARSLARRARVLEQAADDLLHALGLVAISSSAGAIGWPSGLSSSKSFA